MSWNQGPMTFTANGAIPSKLRVKITAGSTTTPPQVELAGLGVTDPFIGVTEYAVATGDLVAVKGKHLDGIQEVTAGAAIAVGAPIYGAAGGKVADTASGAIIGYAVEAATADGDIIGVILV